MSNIIQSLQRSLQTKLPVFDNMDAYVDYIMPYVRPYSEDLEEEKFWIGKRWKAFRDEDNFQEDVLYIFEPDGNFMISIDGNISYGEWKKFDNSNTLVLSISAGGRLVKSELYDLIFLNNDIFILGKHGDQHRVHRKKYFVMGAEGSTGHLEWPELMEKFFAIYQNNWLYTTIVFGMLALIGFLIFLSL